MRYSSILVISLALLTGCSNETTPTSGSPIPSPAAASGSDDFQWTGRITPGDSIEIKGVNGSIRAVATGGSDGFVSATKRGRRNDPSQVSVEVVEHADGVTICAVYPTPVGDPPNQCLPRDAGRMNVNDNDVEVSFEVMLPPGVVFLGRTVNGGVEANQVESDVVATTVNGPIAVATSGQVEASIVNGQITASMGVKDFERDLQIRAVNGNVTVEIPSNTNAQIRASTVNGVVRSDFPLASTSARSARGTIGTGGRLLTLSTVNGDVNLNNGPASAR